MSRQTFLPNLLLLLILFLTFLVYSQTFSHQFVWDDASFILDWPQIRDLPQNLSRFFAGDVAPLHQGVYRPLRSVFYALSYSLWGTLPSGYHYQALAVHLLSTLTVFFITKRLAPRPVALLAGLLFGLHPIHIEAVTWITTSFDTIGSLFFLLAFYLYLRFRDKKTPILFLATALTAFAAFLTYELTLTLPLIILAYEFIFAKTNLKPRQHPLLLTLFAGAILFLAFRLGVLSIVSREQPILGSYWVTALVMSVALVRYLFLAFFPVYLSINHTILPGFTSLFYHDYNRLEPPAPPALTNPVVLFSLLFLVLIAVLLVRYRRQFPLYVFLGFWFFLSLTPVMQIFPQSIIFAEKYTYLATVASSIFLAQLFYSLFTRQSKPQTKFAVTALIVIFTSFYAFQTITRNRVWATPLTLWQASLDQTPDSSFLLNNLGIAYQSQGDTDQAFIALSKAFELNPHQAIVASNLGLMYYYRSDYHRALELQEKAVNLDPNFANAWINLGMVYYHQNRILDEISAYKRALTLNPYSLTATNNLARAYTQIGEYQQALPLYQTALSLSHDQSGIYNDIGIIYHRLEDYDQALIHYQQALILNPDLADALNNLGNVYFELGDYSRARDYFIKALDKDPDHPFAATNLNDALQKLESS